MNEAHKLKRNVVYAISYDCTATLPDDEPGLIEGFWTGEIDTWGKRTIRCVDGKPAYYLFDEEIISVEPL